MAPRKVDASYACKHIDFLKKLKRSGSSGKAQLLDGCDRGQINAVCECVDNVLRGTVKPTPGQKKRLKKHVDVLANLADAKIDWSKKQTFLKTQQGGALVSTVLGVALPALIQYLLSKKA
jgi:hypothetical protein